MKLSKKLFAVLLGLMMALTLAACGGGDAEAEDPAATEATEATEVTEASEEATEENNQAVNPWQDADSAEAAAKGAGVEEFEVGEGEEISLGTVETERYSYMDGIAEAYIPLAAVDMTVRKGRPDAAVEEGDISGDYNEYKHHWKENVKGIKVDCYGNRKGESTKTIWECDGYLYAILAYGAGGDEDFGLSPDDVGSMVNAIQ